jgi:predicted TIM-barrel fold metal-dependent hydrolase
MGTRKRAAFTKQLGPASDGWSEPQDLSRRSLLAGIWALGAGGLLTSGNLFSQAGSPRRLDLHHHYGSPRWIKKLAEAKRQGWQQFQDFTPAKAVETLDKAGVSTAFLSVTEPGVWFGDDFAKERQDAISMSRDMNDYAARMATDYKGRFGVFAVLPLPDIDASLKEIAYAFDTLKVQGVGLLTSYGNKWLGDASFAPVYEELNRRGAILYSHPTDATCCHNLLPGVSPGTIEWNTDTSRAIFSVINDGSAASPIQSIATKYPRIQFVWSHAGGTLTGLAGRFFGGPNSADNLAKPVQPNSRLYHLRRFYYDTAQSTNPIVMQALKSLVGASQIVFGSDYPYSTIADHANALRKCGFTEAELRCIDRENALKILPKY